jgi:hypothetical protein
MDYDIFEEATALDIEIGKHERYLKNIDSILSKLQNTYPCNIYIMPLSDSWKDLDSPDSEMILDAGNQLVLQAIQDERDRIKRKVQELCEEFDKLG